jgi:hypothetical protein
VPFLLAERARSECARSMRAVKGSLGRSLKEWYMELKGPRSTAALRPTWVPFQERKSKQAWKDQLDGLRSLDARNEGQSGDSLGREGVIVQRISQKAAVVRAHWRPFKPFLGRLDQA